MWYNISYQVHKNKPKHTKTLAPNGESNMYEYKNQKSIFDDAKHFMGADLAPDNRWVLLASLIPWDEIEDHYADAFPNKKSGRPAKPARMAFASELIKKKLNLSDEGLVEMVTENPYLQFFLGMAKFSSEPPFDSSTLTYFRKRMSPEMIHEINEYVLEKKKQRKEPPGGSGGEGMGSPANEEVADEASTADGTLILDATCAPQNIKFPTDVSLLNDARQKLESLIDVIHLRSGKIEKKPRTYRNNAKKDFNRFARNRKPKKKGIRKAIKKQLGYLRRDLGHLEKMDLMLLSEKQMAQYHVIRQLFSQQETMYDEKIHTIDDRIVSISQPYVRPMVRGKVNAPVEFGAKIATSVEDGYSRIEGLSWDAFNESTTLQDSIEAYRNRNGAYPKRVLADKIYRTRENMRYCKEHGIQISGPALGRPPKDKELYKAQCKQEREDAGQRNCVEASYGTAKTSYGLGNVMMKLQHTSEVDIHMAILSLNLWKMVKELQVSLHKFIFACIRGIEILVSGRSGFVQ